MDVQIAWAKVFTLSIKTGPGSVRTIKTYEIVPFVMGLTPFLLYSLHFRLSSDPGKVGLIKVQLPLSASDDPSCGDETFPGKSIKASSTQSR